MPVRTRYAHGCVRRFDGGKPIVDTGRAVNLATAARIEVDVNEGTGGRLTSLFVVTQMIALVARRLRPVPSVSRGANSSGATGWVVTTEKFNCGNYLRFRPRGALECTWCSA